LIEMHAWLRAGMARIGLSEHKMHPQGIGRVSSTMALSVHANRHLLKLPPHFLKCSSPNRLPCVHFLYLFRILESTDLNNQPICEVQDRVNNMPKPSKPRRGFTPLPSLDFHFSGLNAAQTIHKNQDPQRAFRGASVGSTHASLSGCGN